ncbi:hypothetical protein BH11MYX1_BH11MYX1_47510 [soil metagenome]
MVSLTLENMRALLFAVDEPTTRLEPCAGAVRGLLKLLVVFAGCGLMSPTLVAAQPAVAPAPAVTSAPTPDALASSIVVTSPSAGLVLWRAFATGRIEQVPFPWAKLSVIDSLVVAPDGRNVTYVEGGSDYGPLVVRALAGGAKTLVASHVSGQELLAVAWSPDGRKVLYAHRRAGRLRADCDFSGCPPAGPSSYFVFDRHDRKSVKIDVVGELAAWLPSGAMVFVDDDGALTRIDRGVKQAVAVGSYRHMDFALDVVGGRLLSIGWDETSKHANVLALDLATWNETTLAPPAPYATYMAPHASPSGKHLAWFAFSPHLQAALVVDGKTIVAATHELVDYSWIGEDTLLAHYADRLDVIDATDGSVKGSRATDAHDVWPSR